MKILLILTIVTVVFGHEIFESSKTVDVNEVPQPTATQLQPVESEGEKKLNKRSYGWSPWIYSSHSYGHGWPSYGHGHGWSGGWGGHGWNGGWYPSWPWWYGGFHGDWHGGHGGWHSKW